MKTKNVYTVRRGKMKVHVIRSPKDILPPATMEAARADALLANELTGDEPIIELVNRIVHTGLAMKANGFGIHQSVRPSTSSASSGVSYFMASGILRNRIMFPQRLFSCAVSRLKIMANLQLSVTNVLQVGTCTFHLSPSVCLRMQVIAVPTELGEELLVKLG